MGLLDVLNGMQNGPRGARNPNSGGGGMSPITMAILGVLAYKAMKGLTGQSANQNTPGGGAPGGIPNSTANSGGLGGLFPGGLGGLLPGGLGGLLAGGAAGGILSGGLNDLLKQFQQTGLGDVAKSWVGTGPNQAISPDDMEKALGPEQIDHLSQETGLPRNELLEGLSQQLPQVVDQLTPQGRVPSAQELSL